MKIDCAGLTDVGLKREHNEDYYTILEDELVYILADGMGGHASGQVASRLAVENMIKFLLEMVTEPDFEMPYKCNASTEAEILLSNAIQYANERVYIESMKDRKLDGMGTTITAIKAMGDHLALAHVGDSRIYRFRNGKLTQLSEDHSLLNHYIKTKGLTEEEIKNFKNTNVIIKAVGLKDYVKPDTQSHRQVAGDIYLMCSDGLSDLVEDWVISQVLEGEGDDLHEAARSLIRLANQSGGKDNITVVLIKILEPPRDEEATDPMGRAVMPDMSNVSLPPSRSAPVPPPSSPAPARSAAPPTRSPAPPARSPAPPSPSPPPGRTAPPAPRRPSKGEAPPAARRPTLKLAKKSKDGAQLQEIARKEGAKRRRAAPPPMDPRAPKPKARTTDRLPPSQPTPKRDPTLPSIIISDDLYDDE